MISEKDVSHETKKNHRKSGNVTDRKTREKDDYYNTPAEAVYALLDREEFVGAISEPACGEGHISEALIVRGHEVVSSDLVDRGYGTPRVDYLMEYRAVAPNVITNPPFKLAIKFIIRALALTTGKVAMFLPLAYLSSDGRKRQLWDVTPLARVYVFSYRVESLKNGTDKGKGGGGMINFAWYVWEHGHAGPPTLHFI